MSQTPHPHDPFGTEPATPAPGSDPAPADSSSHEETGQSVPGAGPAEASQSAAADEPGAGQTEASPRGPAGDDEVGSPTSDPALHPHDPYAYDAGSQSAATSPGGTASVPPAQDPSASGPAGAQDPYGVPASPAAQDPYEVPPSADGQPHYAAPASGAGAGAGQGGYPGGAPGRSGPQNPYGAQGQPGGQHQYGAQGQYGQQSHGAQGGAPGAADLNTPPPGIKGVHDGPLSGQPMQDSDARTWALVVHLAALLQFAIPFFGGLVAQIVLFVIFKDRNRFVRYNGAEALNGTIAAMITSFVLGIAFAIITVITLGIGSFLFGLLFIPQVVQAIFAIIGAVKAYQGEWWNYPVNLRLVK
ncbi:MULTISPECIES: DUF4870 domain-containing protein [unclassified Brachybacterium]|uniref:DUF4870 domain-containing protein n=1 Tax=unclassified Brachybacterium TaxID=2623841 RepID=UPI00360DE6B5